VTGPYTSSKLLDGGHGVEVFLGRMDPGLTEIVSWTQVTKNDKADFFPDAWIAGGELVSLGENLGRDGNWKAGGVVKGKLVELSPTPSPSDIAPYKRCLVAGHYALEDGEEVAALHWGILDSKIVEKNKRTVGKTYKLQLEPFDNRKDLRNERQSNQLKDFTLELYLDRTE